MKIQSNVPVIPNTISQIDNADANNVYIGSARVGTATSTGDWQIRKIVTSGGVISILYANGTTAYDKTWNSRASYSYS